MAKLNADIFKSFLAKPQPARSTATAKVAVEASQWEPKPGQPAVPTVIFNPPDSKPFSCGKVKVALALTLTDAQVSAMDALPAALLNLTAKQVRFIRAHAAEVTALASHLGIV